MIIYTQMKVSELFTTSVYTQTEVSIVSTPHNLRPRKGKEECTYMDGMHI